MKQESLSSAPLSPEQIYLESLFPEHGTIEPLPESLWSEILARYGEHPYETITTARQKEVPEQLIRQYAFQVLHHNVGAGDFRFVSDLMRNAKLGSPEAVAYFQDLQKKSEDERAEKEKQTTKDSELKDESKRHTISLSPKATVGDLVRELNSDTLAEETKDAFWAEMADNFPDETATELFDAMADPKSFGTKLADYFGGSLEGLDVELPIKVVRKKKFKKNKH